MNEQGSQKICCRCGIAKDESEFTFKDLARQVRHGYCRECHARWNREHYLRNRDTYIANARRNSPLYRAEGLRRLVDYLRAHPCVDCGEADLLVLEFDHRDGATKRLAVSAMLGRFGWSVIEAEIAKCDVRCANCHHRKTAHDRQYAKVTLAQLVAEEIAGAAGLEPATSDFGDRRSTN